MNPPMPKDKDILKEVICDAAIKIFDYPTEPYPKSFIAISKPDGTIELLHTQADVLHLDL